MTVEFFVGQSIYCVPYRGNPREVKVTGIGRRWVYTKYGRFDKDTMFFDGGGYSSPAKAYLSQESFEFERDRQKSWESIRQFVSSCWKIPEHLSIGDMEKINKLLRNENG